MNEIGINLSTHCFDDGISVFKQPEVMLKHKNFIFAKNGSGKSTFSKIVKQQLLSGYDVRIYNGFDTMLGENENLNAFALSVNANENEQLIREKQKEIDIHNTELNHIVAKIGERDSGNQDAESLSKKLQDAEKQVSIEEREIEKFYTVSAAQIKNRSAPQVSNTSYTKVNFKREMDYAEQLQDDEIKLLEETAKTDKKTAQKIVWQKVNLVSYLNSTNEILSSEVEAKTHILRFNDDPEKISFAERGLKVHKHEEGEICAFCGSPIAQETFSELEKYFSADEVQRLKDRINLGKNKINDLVNIIEAINIRKSNFYPDFRTQADEFWNQVVMQKEKIVRFCKVLEESLDDKEKNLFSS